MKLNRIFIHIITAVLMVLLFNTAHAERDYKCYAKASDGIAYLLVLSANSAEEAKYIGYSKKVYNSKWKKEFIVKYISECITISEQFKTKQARKLDNETEM